MKENDFGAFDALAKEILSPARYRHTLGVVDAAAMLAKMYGADINKARTAAYLHDITKDKSYDEQLELCSHYGIVPSGIELASRPLLHAVTGAAYAEKELGIGDREVLDAIRWHTTGRKGMTLLDKVIYLADYIEVNRDFPGVESVRALVDEGADAAMLKALANTVIEIAGKPAPIHTDTVECFNQLLIERSRHNG